MRLKIRFYDLLEDEFRMELFDLMAARGLPDIAELLDNDPDMLNIGGVHIPFVRVKFPGTTWIIYLNTEEQISHQSITEILRAFFSAKTECFDLKESLWKYFVNGCIAFRDGGQLGYTIWQYKKSRKENSLPDGHAELPGKAGGCRASQRQGVALRCFRGKSSSRSSGIFPENLAYSESIRPSRPMFGTTAATEY